MVKIWVTYSILSFCPMSFVLRVKGNSKKVQDRQTCQVSVSYGPEEKFTHFHCQNLAGLERLKLSSCSHANQSVNIITVWKRFAHLSNCSFLKTLATLVLTIEALATISSTRGFEREKEPRGPHTFIILFPSAPIDSVLSLAHHPP